MLDGGTAAALVLGPASSAGGAGAGGGAKADVGAEVEAEESALVESEVPAFFALNLILRLLPSVDVDPDGPADADEDAAAGADADDEAVAAIQEPAGTLEPPLGSPGVVGFEALNSVVELLDAPAVAAAAEEVDARLDAKAASMPERRGPL